MPKKYTIKSGDTLGNIAETYGVSIDDILASNEFIKNPSLIRAGDKINIPSKNSGFFDFLNFFKDKGKEEDIEYEKVRVSTSEPKKSKGVTNKSDAEMWYNSVNPGIDTSESSAIFHGPGILWRMATDGKREDVATPHEELLWEAYLTGDISKLPPSNWRFDDDDENAQYVGLPQEQSAIIQAIADTMYARMNKGKVKHTIYPGGVVEDDRMRRSVNRDNDLAEKIMSHPGEWILVNEGNSPVRIKMGEDGDEYTYTGLGGLKNFSVRWDPDRKMLDVKDDYDFKKNDKVEWILPERDIPLRIRESIIFNPDEGGIIYKDSKKDLSKLRDNEKNIVKYLKDRGYTFRYENGGAIIENEDGKYNPSEKRIREIVNMVNSSDANFVKRLKQKNRAYLNDWEHEGSIATHKMAVEVDEDGKIYMYPTVQEINGYLHDFTNPRYNADNFDALRWAKKNNDVVEFDDILEALWFSENYKDLGIYPKFENGGPVSEKSAEQNLKEERETRDWISGWLEARKDILGKNARVDEEFNSPSSKSDLEFGEDEYKRQMGQYDSMDRVNYDVNGLPIDESKREFLRATVRDYAGKNIEDDELLNDELKKMFEGFVSSSDSDDRFLYFPKYPTKNIRTHENTHTLSYRDPVYGPSTAQSRRIADRMNTGESLMEGVEYEDYIDDANEIYSRLMEFRRENNLDPKKKYTKDDIKSLREKYKNKNDDNDSYGVIDRYNDDFLLFLLNDIAYNKNSGDSGIQYAETGGPGGSRWLNDAAYRDSISTERDRYHQERVKRIEDGKPVDINYTIKGSSNGDVDREVALVMNALKQNINDKTLSSGLRDALEKIEEDRKEKVGDAKRNVNSVLAGVSLLGALYGIAPGWMNMKFGLDPKKAQLISSSVGLGTDLGQLSLADSDFEKYENSIESAGDLAGIIGSTDVMQRIGRYGPVVDAILDKYGRSAAIYDLVRAPYEIYTNVAESIKKYGGMVKMNPGGGIKEKVKLLYDKLKDDAGMSDILALGVIGNLWHESGGLNEEAVGDTNTSDHAYGIQQWRGERKKKLFEFAKNRGHEKPTYEDEVDFLIEEFNTGNGGFLYGDKGKSSKAGYYNYSKSDFLQSGSLSDAVVSWNLGSGRPHKDFIANDSRLKYAEKAAKILGIKIPESESYYGNQGYNPDGVDMRTYMAQTSEEPATFNINITAEKEDNNFDDWMNTYGKEMIASMYARQNEADEKSAEEERLKKAMKEEEERTKAEQAEKRQREALIAAILPNLQLSIKGMSRTES